jgi:WD40 repeat protein
MYSASADGSVCFWEISDLTGDALVVATAHGHTDEVTGLVLYKSLLLSCSNDGTVRLWDKVTADALR